MKENSAIHARFAMKLALLRPIIIFRPEDDCKKREVIGEEWVVIESRG